MLCIDPKNGKSLSIHIGIGDSSSFNYRPHILPLIEVKLPELIKFHSQLTYIYVSIVAP